MMPGALSTIAGLGKDNGEAPQQQAACCQPPQTVPTTSVGRYCKLYLGTMGTENCREVLLEREKGCRQI